MFDSAYPLTIDRTPIEVYDDTTFSGNGVKFTLMKNAPTTIYKAGVPLISPKNPQAAKNLCFHDLVLDGNRDYQAEVQKLYAKPWGHNFHTFFLLGYYGCVNYANAYNCEFYNINYQNSLGDLVRCEGGTNIKVHDITANRGGHDVVYLTATNAEIYNMNVQMAVNAAARLKSSHNVKIYNNTFTGTSIAYSPAVEIGSDTRNWTMGDIEVYNNTIKNTLGPGIQVASSVTGDGKVLVHHNFLDGCGRLPATYSGVGGIVFDGIPIDVYNNTVVNSRGYGIGAVDYDGGSSYKFTANVFRNIVTGTVKSAVVGQGSGSGIINLYPSRCTFNCYENDVYGNLTNLYNVTNLNGLSVDPLFIGNGDYHLQAGSPCLAWGRYAGMPIVTPVPTPVTPTPDDPNNETPITTKYTDPDTVRYTTRYTSYGPSHVQKTVVLESKGRTIRVDNVGYSIASSQNGILVGGKITGQEEGGDEIILAEWEVSKTDWRIRSKDVAETFSKGKDVTLRWHLKTGNSSYKALMQFCNYTFTLI